MAYIQRVNDLSNSAFGFAEPYVDALQRLDTQSFGILRVESGLNRGKW